MTQEIRTITIGAGQARPRRRSQKHTRRRVRLNGWTVAKYAALTVAGVLLFRAGAAYALTERGYKAIGGEVFALFLPRVLLHNFRNGAGLYQGNQIYFSGGKGP